MPEIRVKRKQGAIGAETLLPGALGVIGDYLLYGARGTDDVTAAAPEIVAAVGIANAFTAANTFAGATTFADAPTITTPGTADASVLRYDQVLAAGKVKLSVLPDTVLGQMEYIGIWNATTGLATVELRTDTGSYQKGHYYIVGTAGTKTPGAATGEYAVGDWLVYNGTTWDKIDNTDAVASVAGLMGVITKAALLTALNVADGAEVNVQSDWNAASGDAQILNKPSIYPAAYKLNSNIDGANVNDFVYVSEKSADSITLAANTVDSGAGQKIRVNYAVNSDVAIDLAGGTIGQVPYQSGAGATEFLAANTTIVPMYLQSKASVGGTGVAPTWVAAVERANKLSGGLIGQIPYQSAADTTVFLAANVTTTKKYLQSVGNGSVGAAPVWVDSVANADKADLLQSSDDQYGQLKVTGGAQDSIYLVGITYEYPSGADNVHVYAATIAGTANDISGGSLGGVAYQSSSNNTGFVDPNITTTKKYLMQVGNGSVSAAPQWTDVIDGGAW